MVLFLVYIDDVYCFHPDDPEEAWDAMETYRRISRERNCLTSVGSKNFFYACSQHANLSFL